MELIDKDLKRMKSFNKLVKKYLETFQSWEKEKQPTFLMSIMKSVLKRNSNKYLLGYKKMYFDIYLAFVIKDQFRREEEGIEIEDTIIDTSFQKDIKDIMKRIKKYRLYNYFTKHGFRDNGVEFVPYNYFLNDFYDLQYDQFYDDKEENQISSILETKYDSLEKYYQLEKDKQFQN